MKFLLAISGGVDSMVLLWLFEQLSCEFGVIHINHQLRDASKEEEEYLRNYCFEKNIPFECKRWDTPSDSEEAARNFRYKVFDEVMKQGEFDILCTAHHKNDVAETMTRRFIQGCHPFHLTVLEELQTFSSGFLWRPLLSVTKSEIREFAEKMEIKYFEDETNMSLKFQRNRIRHKILPDFKEENEQVINSLMRMNEQLYDEREMLMELLNEKLILSYDSNRGCFNLNNWPKNLHKGLIWGLAEQITKKTGMRWTEGIIDHLLLLIQSTNGTKILEYKQYYFIREYHQLFIKEKKILDSQNITEEIILIENQWCLIDTQHLVYYGEQKPSIPKGYNELSCFLVPPQKIKLRHPKAQDKIAIDNQHHQKLSRLFINRKIPSLQRPKQWVIEGEKEILGVLGLRLSYLRNLRENGKMNYIIYYTLRE